MLDFLVSRFAGEPSKPVLIPTTDREIDFVCDHAQVLSRHFAFQESYSNGLAQAMVTKASLYQLCADHGVAVARWLEIRCRELGAIEGQINLTIFVKPSRIHEIKDTMAGHKGWIVRCRADFEELQTRLPRNDHALIVQEIIPGPESNIALHCAYFDEKGRSQQSFTGRKLRQYPPGFGFASLVVSEDDEEAREISERFLTAIGYYGIAASEFKRDPRDGQIKLIEINPRPSLWFGVTSEAGKHLALAAYRELGTGHNAIPDGKQRTGVGWRFGIRDMYSSYFYRTTQFILPPPDITAFSSASPIVDAVQCADDPRPARFERRKAARAVVRRLFGVGAGPSEEVAK